MNIEFETKNIIREGFPQEDKIRLIKRFANFEREDIIRALNKRFESHENICGKIYLEMVRRRQ